MFGCFKPLLCVVCRHSISLMSLFHGRLASRNQENRIGRRDSSPDFFPEGGKTSVHRLIFQAQMGKNLNILSTSQCTVRYRETVDFYRFTADQFHVQSERILDQRENGVKIGILSVKTIFHLQCKNTYHLRKV